MQIGIGAWRWDQHYTKQNQRLEDHYDEALESVAAAGADSFEPFLPTHEADQERLIVALQKYSLAMPSTYRNIRLHEPDAEDSFEEILASARWAYGMGARQLTVNAEPIAWGQPLDKTDAQLMQQLTNFDVLQKALAEEGILVAYHIHDAELRQGAREFLTMITHARVWFCFDPHWVYRGCGNSEISVQTILKLYGSRLQALHLRQSEGGIFTETFQQIGDIDYTDISAFVRAHCPNIPIYVEQGWEVGTPETLTRPESDRRSLTAARALFGG
ncbi:sugar phosphate isomerase/epimerase family protein [Armatimonas sp.]|uniref:sugar phosphate isomerase/epimerase family protein n=1 Tax=Armatimonas sp. TaxID=1872638 RepID=UPI003753B090